MIRSQAYLNFEKHLTLIALFLFCLITEIKVYWWAFILIFTLLLLRKMALQLYAAFNFIVGALFISGPIKEMYFKESLVFSESPFAIHVHYLIVYIVHLVVFYLLLKLSKVTNKFLVGLIAISACLPIPIYFNNLEFSLKIILLLYIKSIWYNLFLILYYEKEKILIFDFLICQIPFFGLSVNTFLPIPPLLYKYFDRQKIDYDRKSSGALSMFLVLIFMFLIFQAGIKLSQSNELFDLMGLGYPTVQFYGKLILLGKNLALIERWIVTIGMFLPFFYMIFLSQGVQVLIQRIIGCNIKSPIYSIHKANSLFEFYEHLNYYYSKLLIDIFITPINRVLFRIKAQKSFYYLSPFIGIIFCGYLYHYLKLFTEQKNYNNLSYEGLDSVIFYWLITASLTTVSLVISLRPNGLRKMRITRILTYFFISIITFVFVKNYQFPGFSLVERLAWIKSLFLF